MPINITGPFGQSITVRLAREISPALNLKMASGRRVSIRMVNPLGGLGEGEGVGTIAVESVFEAVGYAFADGAGEASVAAAVGSLAAVTADGAGSMSSNAALISVGEVFVDGAASIAASASVAGVSDAFATEWLLTLEGNDLTMSNAQVLTLDGTDLILEAA